MAYEARSQYEYGDPVSETIAREERTDHHLARARGERLELLTAAIVSGLDARALLTDRAVATVIVFHLLADHLYANAAIDLPALHREEA